MVNPVFQQLSSLRTPPADAMMHYRNNRIQRDIVVKSALMHTQEELASARTEWRSFPDTKNTLGRVALTLEDRTMTTVHYQAPADCQLCWRHSTHIPFTWVLQGGCSTTSQVGKQPLWLFFLEKGQNEQRWMLFLSLAGTEGRSRTSLFYNSHYKWTL